MDSTSKDPRRWWALSAMCLAVFLVAVDGTVLSLATPSIVEDLEPTASQVLWIGDIYSFVLAGLLITMGNLGDRFGRKLLLLVGGTLRADLDRRGLLRHRGDADPEPGAARGGRRHVDAIDARADALDLRRRR
jgi:hypothetical protein